MTTKDLKNFISALHMPAIVADNEGVCHAVNQAVMETFNSEFCGKLETFFGTHISHGQLSFVNMQYAEVRNDRRQKVSLESIVIDGKSKTVHFSRLHKSYILILLEDEGAQKQLEKRMYRSEELLKTLFESADEGIVILQDGTVQDCNTRIEEMTAYSRADLLSLELAARSYGDPSDFKQHIAEIERSGFSLFNWEIRHKNGDVIHTQVQGIYLELQGDATLLLLITDKSAEYEALIEAEKSQFRYNKIIELMPLPVVMCNLDGYATFMNKAFVKMFGYQLEDIPHISIWWEKTIPDPVLRKQALLDWERSMRELSDSSIVGAHPLSSQFITKSGEKKIVDTRLMMLDGQVIAIITDLTERVKAEDALKESEERLAYSLEATNDGLMDWNLRDNSFYFSHRWFSMLGYNPSQMERSYEMWTGLIHPDDRKMFDATIELYRNRLDSGYELEYRLRRKDGEYSWILARGRAVEWDINGRAVRMIGTHIDISERKTADRELRYLRFFQELLIDSMPSVIIAINENGVITEWNLQAEVKYAVLKAEVEGLELLKQKLLSPALKVLIRKGLDEGGQLNRERFKDSDGWYSVSMFSLIDSKIKGYVIRLDSIDEQMKLEEMMIHSEKMLSVGGLAAGMAHEINNPLAGIMQCAQVLENRLTKDLKANHKVAEELGMTVEKIRDYNERRGIVEKLNMILEAGSRAAQIVSDMLTFARKGDIGYSTHNLNEIIDRSLLLAGTDYDMKKKYDFRKIEIQKEGQCEEALIQCDMNQIQQVVLNLLKNSAQAMTGLEYPLIRIRCFYKKEMVHLYLEDNGPGIPDDIRSRIFEPFFTTKEVGVGTGLGLSVSYFIISENHKGTIEAIHSDLGGACFHLAFPAVEK